MKHIKMAAGLAHVDYGHIADLVAEADAAGVDYIHSDAADMHDLKNMQLMGGHQIIEEFVRIPKKISNVIFIQETATDCLLRKLRQRM